MPRVASAQPLPQRLEDEALAGLPAESEPRAGLRATRRRGRHPDGSGSISRLQVTHKSQLETPAPASSSVLRGSPQRSTAISAQKLREAHLSPGLLQHEPQTTEVPSAGRQLWPGSRWPSEAPPGTRNRGPRASRGRPSPRAPCLLGRCGTTASEKPPREHASRPPRRLLVCSRQSFPQWPRTWGGRLCAGLSTQGGATQKPSRPGAAPVPSPRTRGLLRRSALTTGEEGAHGGAEPRPSFWGSVPFTTVPFTTEPVSLSQPNKACM